MSWIALATVVEVRELAETALAALVGGTVVTLTFSIAILGAAKVGDMREAGRGAAATVAAALGALGLLAAIATVAIGLIVMLR